VSLLKTACWNAVAFALFWLKKKPFRIARNGIFQPGII